jgi:hypothetical protein
MRSPGIGGDNSLVVRLTVFSTLTAFKEAALLAQAVAAKSNVNNNVENFFIVQSFRCVCVIGKSHMLRR